MDVITKFILNDIVFYCTAHVDSTPHPCYVFIILHDKELIKKFGEEITIKTDFKNLLPRKNDYPELVELKQAIFNIINTKPEFIAARRKLALGDQPGVFASVYKPLPVLARNSGMPVTTAA